MAYEKPVIVAEIGINHNGSLPMAKNLIALAANYGADFVKFQKRTPRLCVPEDQKQQRRLTIFGPMTYLEYKERLEFGREEYDEIDRYCKHLGIGWFASPWDEKSVHFLQRYDPPFLKIASASITDCDLLDAVKESGVPVVMSTGMSNRDEIDTALHCLDGQVRYLLHTTSSYPTPNCEMNMRKINTLRKLYGESCRIGFSNHCIDLIYLVQAVVMGAEMLEFHITLDRSLPGTDQYASIGPVGFDRVMQHLSNIGVGWGDGNLHVLKSEEPVRLKLRRSL